MRRGLLICAVVLCLPGAASARPGDLDPSFGRGGKVIDPRLESVGDLAVAADGSLRLAGYTGSGSAVLGFAPDGRRAPGFGAAGVMTPAVSAGAIRLDGAGRVVLAGAALPPADPAAAVERLLPDGTPDPTFGDGGVATVTPADAEFFLPTALAIAPGGRLFVAGPAAEGAEYGAEIAALRPDGSLDPGFGSGGLLFLGSTGFTDRPAVGVRPDSSLLIAESVGDPYDSDVIVRSVSPAGVVDPGFGGVRLDVGGDEKPTGIEIAADGSFLLSGLEL